MSMQVVAATIALIVGACAFAQPPQDKPPNPSEARAKFIKKCFRDRTKAACEAPREARVAQNG